MRNSKKFIQKTKNIVLSALSIAMMSSAIGTNLVTTVLAEGDDKRTVTYHIEKDESFTVDPKKPEVVTDNNIDKKEETVGIGGEFSYPVVEAGYIFDGWYSDKAMSEDDIEVYAQSGDTDLDLYGSIIKDDGKKATLTVTITDKNTHDPLSGQTVDVYAIDALPTDDPIASGTTDENGEVVLNNIPRGKYTVYERDTTGVYGGETYLSYDVLNFTKGTKTNFDISFENIKLKTVTISFDLNGGTATGSQFATATRTSDSYMLSVGIPSKDGYTFDGWYINDTDTKFDFGKTIAANWADAYDTEELTDFTITAKYTENAKKTYTFSFKDVNDTDPQDLSTYTFSVEATEGSSAVMVQNEDGKTLGDILNELYGLGYTRAGNETLYTAVSYGGKTQEGTKIPDNVVITVKHGYTYDSVKTTTDNVTRTIKYVYEDGSEAATTIKQVAKLTHYAESEATDNVTGGKTTVPATTQVTQRWGSRKSPTLDGYLPDIKNVDAVEDAASLTKDEEVTVTYKEVVDPIKVEVVIQADSQTVTYDGQEHTLNTYTFTSDNADYGEYDFEYVGNASAKGTNAGDYTLMFNAKDFENKNSAYSVKFVVKSGRLTINRKTVTVTAQDASKKVGEKDPEFTATVDGTLNGDKVEYRVSRQRGESNGTYAITASGKKNQGNYQLQFVNGTFVIEAVKKPIDDTPIQPTDPVKPAEERNYVGWETNSEDRDQTITFAGIKTTLIDYTESTAAAKEGIYYLTDRVEYIGLEPNTRYKLVGTLMDRETGEPLEGVGPVEKEFTVKVADGSYSGMKFEVAKELVDGKTVVAFEVLYKASTDEEIAKHEDLEDQNQTIKFVGPTIKTRFAVITDNEDIDVEKETYVVDYVNYTNLKVGKKYTLTGTVMDKDTEEKLAGTDSVTIEFTPETTDGTVQVPFTISNSLLEDKTIVAFEELRQGNKLIAIHADINDADQTIDNPLNEMPKVKTTATAEDGSKVVEVSKQAVVVDNVELKKLTVGTEYTLTGTLHIKNEDGIDAGAYKNADGSEYTVIKTFTADSKTMNVEMRFTVDATQLKGRETVVFETLKWTDELDKEWKVEHSEIKDKDQTVRFYEKPTMKTTAKSEFGGKTVEPKQDVKIIDTVEFTNLEIGKEYVVYGTLHINRDGKDVGTVGQTKGVSFVPTTTDGSVDVEFVIDASNIPEGEKLVAFEELKENGVTIAIHADINDEGQTVTVKKTEIKTTATSANGGKTVEMSEKTIIKDTVSFTGLVPGKEYTMHGTLHFKDTGAETGAPVEQKFIPQTSDGSVVLTFTYDTRNIEGKELVVFEKLTTLDADGKVVDVASHEDINDEGQTVKVVKKPETPSSNPTPTPETPNNPTPTPVTPTVVQRVNTGTGSALMIFGGVAVVALVGLVVVLVSRKKKEDKE